ncbi:MAG: ABC transporter substrate-binding protein, partial [Alphaproteobacteria bacterium]
EYLALFEDVIVDSWATRFTKYSGQRFEITAESRIPGSANQTAVIVRSLIWTNPDTPVRVNWRVANAGEIYKITDVIVEGISMANTQRDEFASLVRKNGFSGLLASLRTKSGQDGKLAALVGAQQYEILPASGAAPAAVAEQEPAPVIAGTLAIQLASLRSSARAQVAWEHLMAKYPLMLRGHELSVERVDLADRGVFYRVRTGNYSRHTDASSVCRQFTDAGQDCLVVQR